MKFRTKRAARAGRRLGLFLVVAGIVGFAAWWYGAGTSDSPATEPGRDRTVATAGAAELGGASPTATRLDPASSGSVAEAPDRDAALELYRTGRIEEAAAALIAYLEGRPDDTEVAAVLAQVQWLRGDAASSAARYEAVIAQAGSDPDLLYQLALVMRSEGRLVESIEELGAALRLRPQATEFRMELARTLRMAGAAERAVGEWKAVISALPPDDLALAGCYYELGLAHLSAGDAASAREALERGAALRPGDPAFAAQLEALRVDASAVGAGT